MKAKYLAAAALLLIVGIWAGVRLFRGDARRVRRQFNLLAERVGKKAQERPLTSVHRAQSIGTLFASECLCRGRGHVEQLSGNYTRREISQQAAFVRAQFETISLRFYNLDIEFPSKTVANVVLAARISGQLAGGEPVDEAHELNCTLTKAEDAWLFSHIEVVDVLEK